MTREDIIKNFDPNAPGVAGNIFGLPFSPENAQLIIIPVPWEVTVSYNTGTALGPDAVYKASSQVDLAMKNIPDAWKLGISMLPIQKTMLDESAILRELALAHIKALESGEKIEINNPVVARINAACENLNIYIKTVTQKYLSEGKMVALLGGDHSTPLGFIRALAGNYKSFGILQFDAHFDLRKSYEGFTYSHASIMHNALKLPAVQKLVQVGIRDYCDEELQFISKTQRVVTFFDQDIKDQLFEGNTWSHICQEIIEQLPDNIYISFDIDGLNPKLCPNTGTPVAGGLEFEQAIFLIRKIVKAGKKIIGFDVNEIAPGSDDWDANVGARLLYNLCNWMAVSQGKLKTI
ncbi:agmatinase family protein [Chryseosolibacter indicus]|uniref:Agmatinase family protein n=1 Tax=Chryseosolibacter indicus TaxID=2782351 RepID=A0ABS5VV99_9BACT|nr:agmatinase family protein [Chryseosolibacter indicus]MBT1705357.1 agmatinase family protein [Chryseosolibacter indicus]